MGQTLELQASDGNTFAAYRADPAAKARAAIVVIQEIFGVNAHIREVCDGFAAVGYVAIAPALFDRVVPGLELGYDAEDVTRGRDLAFPLGYEAPLLDLTAAVELGRTVGRVGAVGYCWGGSLAYLCACKLDIDCAVGYYGGQIASILDADPSAYPSAPTMLHFGKHDTGIPMEDVDRIREENPDMPLYLYDAGHGFNCNHRASYDEAAATLARDRTREFLATHVSS